MRHGLRSGTAPGPACKRMAVEEGIAGGAPGMPATYVAKGHLYFDYDLRQALATGLINALMTSAATGYDVNVWDRMGYFYDTRAWIPKNVTLVNKTAFDRLDKPIQDSVLKVAAAAEARGWWWSQEKSKWYTEQLAAHGMKVLPASVALKTGLQEIGERLTAEWLMRAGADGPAIIDAYRRLRM